MQKSGLVPNISSCHEAQELNEAYRHKTLKPTNNCIINFTLLVWSEHKRNITVLALIHATIQCLKNPPIK